MITPGEELTPELFLRMKREVERRGRIWSAPPIESSNITSGVMLRSVAGPGAAPGVREMVVLARLQDIVSFGITIVYDWNEVVYDPSRGDFVPKPGGRRSFLLAGESFTPFNDKQAYELNNAILSGPFDDGVHLYPVNQVVELNPIVDNQGEPTGFWWFDYRQSQDRSLITIDRAFGNDCGWVGAPDTNVANSACSPVGYRFGSPYGQAIGLFTPFSVSGSSFLNDNPCTALGTPLLGGCTTPNDGNHGDAVTYQSCCANPLPEVLHMTIPSGEVSGSFNDTLPPGTYEFDFVLADGLWESTTAITNAILAPNAGNKVTFGDFPGRAKCSIQPFGVFTGTANTIFVSCNPFMVVIEWIGQAGRQTLAFTL